jgi:hypothetical protein
MRDHLSPVNHGNVVSEREQELHVVLDDDDGDFPFQRADELGEPRPAVGAEAGRRLVEEQELRAGGERYRDLQRAPRAIGQ